MRDSFAGKVGQMLSNRKIILERETEENGRDSNGLKLNAA